MLIRCDILGFGVQVCAWCGDVLFLCIRTIWMDRNGICVHESVGGSNEVALDVNIVPFCTLMNVENVYWQCDSDLS